MKTSWLLSLIATANEKLDDRRMMRRYTAGILRGFQRSRRLRSQGRTGGRPWSRRRPHRASLAWDAFDGRNDFSLAWGRHAVGGICPLLFVAGFHLCEFFGPRRSVRKAGRIANGAARRHCPARRAPLSISLEKRTFRHWDGAMPRPASPFIWPARLRWTPAIDVRPSWNWALLRLAA
jgi:hypothetical protein